MEKFWARVKRYFGDLFYRHLFHGTICHLLGRHRDLRVVGEVAKKGFRPHTMYQCAKCLAFWIPDVTAKRLGGRG
jgi:hypothetical protein